MRVAKLYPYGFFTPLILNLKRRISMNKIILIIVLHAILSSHAMSQTIWWTGTAGDMDWENSLNWNQSRVPLDTDDVLISNSAEVHITETSSVKSLVVTGASQLIVEDNTSLRIVDATGIGLRILLKSKVTLDPDSSFEITDCQSHAVEINNGEIDAQGSGDISDISGKGIVLLGSGKMTIANSFTLDNIMEEGVVIESGNLKIDGRLKFRELTVGGLINKDSLVIGIDGSIQYESFENLVDYAIDNQDYLRNEGRISMQPLQGNGLKYSGNSTIINTGEIDIDLNIINSSLKGLLGLSGSFTNESSGNLNIRLCNGNLATYMQIDQLATFTNDGLLNLTIEPICVF